MHLSQRVYCHFLLCHNCSDELNRTKPLSKDGHGRAAQGFMILITVHFNVICSVLNQVETLQQAATPLLQVSNPKTSFIIHNKEVQV